jgi:hypothetical protein
MTWDPAISNFTRDDSYFKFHKGWHRSWDPAISNFTRDDTGAGIQLAICICISCGVSRSFLK